MTADDGDDADDIPTIGGEMLHRRRAEFERGMSPVPPVAVLLGLVCAVAFGWEVAVGALDSEERLIAAGALNGPRVKAGEWWRLVTCVFLHGGPDHLLGNLLVLYVLGMAVEHAFGHGRTLLLFLLAGVIGSGFSLIDGRTSVGASGAVFGLAGALVVFFARHGQHYHVRDRRVGTVLAIWAVYQFALGYFNPIIDNWAHVGGFIGGAAVAAVIGSRLPRDEAE